MIPNMYTKGYRSVTVGGQKEMICIELSKHHLDFLYGIAKKKSSTHNLVLKVSMNAII